MTTSTEVRAQDRGAVTLYIAIFAVVLVAVLGLVVDGGGLINAYQRANSIAREAARVAGQQATFSGSGATVDIPAALTAAHNSLTAAGCDWDNTSVSIAADNIISVRCTYNYNPRFIPGTYPISGRGTAQPQRVR